MRKVPPDRSVLPAPRTAAPATNPQVEWVADPALEEDAFLAALAQLLRAARDREARRREGRRPRPAPES
jgi:hypothetical protein